MNCADQTYEKGLYYDGMPCLNVKYSINTFYLKDSKKYLLNEIFPLSKGESLELIAQRIS